MHPLAREALLERRQFIRAALAAAAGGVLVACASDDQRSAATTAGPPTEPRATAASTPPASTAPPTPSSAAPTTTSAAPTTTAAAPTTVPYDPTTPYWLQGNFAPVDREVEGFDLRVEGALPSELDGLYVRNGSNPVAGSSAHWFLGDGMVHGIRLRGGRAEWYRNRWVQTPLLGNGDILGGSDAGAPGGANNSSNTSVVHHAGRLLSLQEVGWPYELSTRDLSTTGATDLGGTLTSAMTAHPKLDPATGLLHGFGYGFVPPYLTYFVVDQQGRVISSEEIPVQRSTMIHDFAITERDVVFWEMPVVFDLELALAREMPFRWQPEVGSRVGVMPLGGPAAAMRWVEIEPCYVFHGTNAWRAGDDVLLDVSRLPTMFADGGDLGPNDVRRWRIGTAGPALTFAEDIVSDRPLDLPTIDRRQLGRAHGHAWYGTTRAALGGFEFAGIVRVDAATGELDAWDPPAESAGEGLFVPAASSSGAGEGFVLTFSHDPSTGTSDLVVLDALRCARGPIARVRLPQRVPFGFHACWVPGEQLDD